MLPNPNPFEYHPLDNGIHQFVLHDGSKETVDSWFERMKSLHNGLNQQVILRHIVLAECDPLPIGYMFQCARRLAAQHRDCCPNRIALLHKEGFYLSFAEAFVRAWQLNHNDRIRFFPISEREAALEWLAADSPT